LIRSCSLTQVGFARSIYSKDAKGNWFWRAKRRFFQKKFVAIQGSGFEAKKQAIFRQSSLLFEGDAAHRLKKEAKDGGKLTFLDQNVSTLNSYKIHL
jgi:hypothetical protein